MTPEERPSPAVRLEAADESFFDAFYALRCEDSNIYWTGHDKAPQKEALHRWFRRELTNPDRKLYAILCDEKAAGYLYLDRLNDTEAEISYGVGESFRGRGVASRALKEALKIACGEWGAQKAVLHIAEPNTPSIRVAQKIGFLPEERTQKRFYAAAGTSFWLRRFVKPLSCGEFSNR